MKRIVTTCILFSFLILFGYSIAAQDMIIMRSGEEIQAKVMEIAPNLIKYKKFENQEGPTYSVEKAKVFMIKFEDGSKEVFKEDAQSTPSNTQVVYADKPRGNQNPLPDRVFNLNLLGLIQFGPIFQFENKISDQLYLTAHFRYAYAGIAYHLVWDYDEEDEMQPGAGGIAVGIKGLSNKTGHAWYYGGFVEYAWTNVNWDVGDPFETEQQYRAIIPAGNFGYRWRNDNGFLVNLGLVAGVAATIKNDEVYVNSGELYDTYPEVRPIAFIELSFGWEL